MVMNDRSAPHHPWVARGRGHVLIVVENVPLGLDHRVRKQVETLLDGGYRVSVITRRDPSNDRHRGVPGLRLLEYRAPREPTRKLEYLVEYAYSLCMASVLALRSRLQGRVDVIQMCQPPDISFTLGTAFKALGARVLVDQRDLLSELYVARYGVAGPWVNRILRSLERASHRAAHHVICVNETLRERVITGSGLDPGSVSIVRNGPVLARVDSATPDPSLKEGRSLLVCWVGMMGKQDRLDLLIEAIGRIVHGSGRTDCQYAIIGDGECMEDVRSLVRRSHLEPWVTLTGWLPEESLFRYLASADLGVDASLQDEVSPVKAMEYMAFGLPFVAFDLRETRALAGEAGTYAAPGDTARLAQEMEEMLADPDRRLARGRSGRQRVESAFAWERQAPIYLDVIDALVTRVATSSRHTRGRRRS
jgi:glycosyltransferase involved in cell wall biosynthesis